MKLDSDNSVPEVLDEIVAIPSPRRIRRSRSWGQALGRTVLFLLLLPLIVTWPLVRLAVPPSAP